jgi:hypothetical protein
LDYLKMAATMYIGSMCFSSWDLDVGEYDNPMRHTWDFSKLPDDTLQLKNCLALGYQQGFQGHPGYSTHGL